MDGRGPTAATVGAMLADAATRAQTLDALERQDGPHDAALAVATAPALTDVMLLPPAECDRALYQRCALLRGRLMVEAEDASAIWGAAFADGRYRNEVRTLGEVHGKTAEQLDRDDALCYACHAISKLGQYSSSGTTACAAAGFSSGRELMGVFMSEDALSSSKRCPADDKPTAMLRLIIELLRSGDLPALAVSGALWSVGTLSFGRPEVGKLAVELGFVELCAICLARTGAAPDWLWRSRSISNAGEGVLSGAGCAIVNVFAGHAGTTAHLDVMLSCGLLDQMLSVVTAFEQGGVKALHTTDRGALYFTLGSIRRTLLHPACRARVRSVASGLVFLLEHPLDVLDEIGWTTDSAAVQMLCALFGRDETGSQFKFTQSQVDSLLRRWSNIVLGEGLLGKSSKPTEETIFILELSISDANKKLMLANDGFVAYLLSGLFIDPNHPRANLSDDIKRWNQTVHAESICQVALFPPGRDALLQNPTVDDALVAVAEKGLSEEARDFAQAALAALRDEKLQVRAEGQKHVMLSYQWDVQATTTRLNQSLIARGYVTWFDLTNMKGSTMDAMSDAIEGADVMLYGVSLPYKESANCRMEANVRQEPQCARMFVSNVTDCTGVVLLVCCCTQYAHQQELEMIPLMMQQDFKPTGWLGLIMGTRMWYSFWDAEKDDDAAFERRVDAVVREIGERCKAMVPEAVTPVREPTPARALVQAQRRKLALEPAPAPSPPTAPSPAPSQTMASAPMPHRAAMVPATPTVAAPEQTFTTGMDQMVSSETTQRGGASMSGGLAEMTSFMREQQKMQLEREEQQREERRQLEAKIEQQRQEERRQFEAKIEWQRQEIERQRQEIERQRQEIERQRQETEQLRAQVAAQPQPAAEAIDEDQLTAMQSRLQSLHEAKLLTDAELFSLEDAIVDCVEVLPTGSVLASEVEKVWKMLLVSSKVESDSTLARQLKRKFV